MPIDIRGRLRAALRAAYCARRMKQVAEKTDPEENMVGGVEYSDREREHDHRVAHQLVDDGFVVLAPARDTVPF
jgi:hypothetical protein